MSDHYYTENPASAHDERQVRLEALGNVLVFTTDAGVFSRDGMDRGTEALLEALHCEDVYARTMHVRLPVFRQLPGNLEFLTHGELARYCRQLLRA